MSARIGERFASARATWLGEARTQLEHDDRVGAAMLTGSLGRGAPDDWSDIDLVVVLARATERDVVANREEFVRSFDSALFVFDSPWNAPLDGAQVNALYAVDGDWPLYVDWDLWPEHLGAIASDVRVLIDRIGLPTIPRPLDDHRSWPRAPRPDRTPELLLRARLAMLPIIAKCLVRNDTDRARRMLSNLECEPDPGEALTDLLAATHEMWASVRTDTDVPLARAIDRMLLATSHAVAGDSTS